jgi:hypothetical protein
MTRKDEDDLTVDDTVEVYRCDTAMEANRAIVEVLSTEHIMAFRRDRVSHALPAPATETGGYYIAVRGAEAAAARRLLRKGLEDRVLDAETGTVIAEAT